jgi:hypothetical protein
MKYLKRFNESNQIEDIKDVFLELKDEGWKFKHESFDLDDDYAFTEEFYIWKKGDSGYYLDGGMCALFNINEVINEILRFIDICEINNIKYRIITSDGQYILDITEKVENLDSINKDDIIETRYVHHKKADKVDIVNLTLFISCQIMK